MSQIKPYLFWIVSGVLLLVLLILGLFVLIPTDETIDASTPRDAYEVKDLLDTEYKDLQKLEARARRGDPNRVFDPQVEADIKTLTNDYLLTKEWKGVIDPHVEKYDQQLKALRQDLIDRSAGLRKEISSDHGKNAWYSAYETITADLVTRMRTARALKVANASGGRAAFAPPAGGAVGEDPLDPKRGNRIREVLGFITTTNLPEATEHDLLTARFRIVEAVAGAVLASEADTLPNPMVGPANPVRAPAAITAWEWKTDTAEKLEGAIEVYATPLRCTVSLQGSESALTAALAQIESLNRPVLIVLGSTLSRIANAPSGSRKPMLANGDAVVAPVALSVDLLVLDFGQMPDLTSVAGPAGGAAPGPGPGPSRSAPGRAPTSVSPPSEDASTSGGRGAVEPE